AAIDVTLECPILQLPVAAVRGLHARAVHAVVADAVRVDATRTPGAAPEAAAAAIHVGLVGVAHPVRAEIGARREQADEPGSGIRRCEAARPFAALRVTVAAASAVEARLVPVGVLVEAAIRAHQRLHAHALLAGVRHAIRIDGAAFAFDAAP